MSRQLTDRNIIYFDVNTRLVKTTQHAVFDETENDRPARTPNAEILGRLRGSLDGSLNDVFDSDVEVPDLDISLSPFTGTEVVDVSISSDPGSPLGFAVSDCPDMGRAFITDIHRHPASFRSMRAFQRKFKGAYVVQVGDEPIFSALDFDRVQATLLHSGKSSIPVTLAPERPVVFDSKSSRHDMVLRPRDLHRIAALLSLPGEDMTSSEYSSAVAATADCMDSVEGIDYVRYD